MVSVRTTPAHQWIVTHANWSPMTGANAVISSTSIAADMTQWNTRSDMACRRIWAGSPATLDPSPVPADSAGASHFAHTAWAVTKAKPPITAAHIKSQEIPIRTSWPHGLAALLQSSTLDPRPADGPTDQVPH